MEQLFEKIFLPAVREEIRQTRSSIRDINLLIEARIIRHLVKFGLLDVIRKEEKYWSRIEKVKKNELFERFVEWEVS